jgi:hypothetical protein
MAVEPQDHKKKEEAASERFSFRHNGEELTFPAVTLDVITPGFVRNNRRRDETDYFMTIVESLAGQNEEVAERLELTEEEIAEGKRLLDIIDTLRWKEHKRLQEQLQKHIGASLGE